MNNTIIVVGGPTASGKTKLSVELAKRLNGEVVSADSMQIYKKMDIGTAKPTQEEMDGIPHHMIDVAEWNENWSVSVYVEEARKCIDDILSRGKLPIVAGGTGLYIDSLLDNRSFASFDGSYREELKKRQEEEGIEALLEELKKIDPETAQRLHIHNEKRILRALEVYYATGKTMTEHNRTSLQEPPRYNALVLFLGYEDRQDMWNRINIRVDEMMKRGLKEEVRQLLDAGIPKDSTAMQAIGYKELVDCIENGGEETEAVSEIKLRTRQYAKRQLTWFKRRENAHWYYWSKELDFDECLEDAMTYLRNNGIE